MIIALPPILSKLNIGGPKVKSFSKISLVLLLVVGFLFIVGLFIAWQVGSCGPGENLTDDILNEHVESGYVSPSVKMHFIEPIILKSGGNFESSKYTFNCISNEQLDSVPDSYRITKISASYYALFNLEEDYSDEKPEPIIFSGGPECSDFIKSNKITNNTEETFVLWLYQCEKSEIIDVIFVPMTSEYKNGDLFMSSERGKMQELLCDILKTS